MEKQISILIVDDHQVVTDGIKLMLQNEDTLRCVGVASNGLEALEQLSKLDAQVVLLDLHMPELNGLETCKRIKIDFPNTKVLMLTMSEESAIIKQMIKIGVDGYLLKSVNQEELLNAIRIVVNGEKYFSSGVKDILMEDVLSLHQAKRKADLPRLSKREKQVLQLIMKELTTSEIADQLFISPGTVETHRRNMLLKLDVRNVAGLVRMALEYNLLER